jgi:hypothetical protein
MLEVQEILEYMCVRAQQVQVVQVYITGTGGTGTFKLKIKIYFIHTTVVLYIKTLLHGTCKTLLHSHK